MITLSSGKHAGEEGNEMRLLRLVCAVVLATLGIGAVPSASMAAGLGLILDEHDFDVCSEDVDRCGSRLSAFWQQVAPRFAGAPRNVAFELLNEPHDKLNGDVWNGLLAQLLTVVRQSNPTRIVVV